ncbi:AAA domain-containing protein [Phyllosticta citribraziliensis]
MLVECFRMDEELMAFISDEFYNGSLICKAKRDIQLEGTIKLTMRSAGSRVWNRRRRIAIDVSTSLAGDRQISSHTYKNTPSLCNESEANALIATISKLLAVRPRPNQTDLRQVDPREILVGSPYSGQRRLLVEKLYQAFPNDVARQIRVMTVAAIQGSQGKVVLLSLTVNKLDNEFDIAFMAQENSLNVALSRGKHCLYIFGNFAPWIRGIHRKDKALVAKKVLSSLHHLVQDLDYKRDVIDVTDYLNILAGQEVTEPAIKDSTFVVNDAQRSNSNAAAAAAGLNNAPRGTGMGSYQTPAAPWRDGSGGGGGQGGKGGKGANKGKGTNKGKGKGKGGPGGGCGPGKGGKGPGGGPGGPGAGQSARVNPY